jgi:hypothetical protein
MFLEGVQLGSFLDWFACYINVAFEQDGLRRHHGRRDSDEHLKGRGCFWHFCLMIRTKV